MRDRCKLQAITRAKRRASELDGYVMLGMKRQALILARKYLLSPKCSGTEFGATLNAVLTFARVRAWRVDVTACFDRLSIRDQRRHRSMMLVFITLAGDYQYARQLLPKRVTGYVDLVLAIDTLLDQDDLQAAEPLIWTCFRALMTKNSEHLLPCMADCLSRYFSKLHEHLSKTEQF